MKEIKRLLYVLCCLVLVACGGDVVVDPTEPTRGAEPPVVEVTAEPGEGRATPTTSGLPNVTEQPDDAYPSQPDPTRPSIGYEETTSEEQADPYPAPEAALPEEGEIDIAFATLSDDDETVWIAMSAGIQCEPESKIYDDINEAAEALQAEDVDVYDAEIEPRIVCAACGCPESTYYRLQIDEAGLETAVSLGFAEDLEQ